MNETTGSKLDRIVRALFALGVITIPMSGIAGLSGLGEMQHELSTYVFLVTLGVFAFVRLAGATAKKERFLPDIVVLPRIALFFFGVIFLSFACNLFDIMGASYRGRGGFEKFLSSLMTVGFCFLLATMSYVLAQERWKSFLAKPLAIGVVLCGVFGLLEVAARWFGVGGGLYAPISNLVHGGFGEMKLDERVRSLAYEPPWLGNYLGFAFPWLVAAWFSSVRLERVFYGCVLALLFGLLGVSLARTGFLMVGGSIGTLILLRTVYLSPKLSGWAHRVVTSILIGMAVTLLAVGAVTHFGGAVAKVIASDSTTNISRLASIMAGFSMFFDHVLFGVGFGQFGFHIERYLPYWAYYSTEYAGGWKEGYGYWPTSYSIYARFGAEMGVFGIALWVGLWAWMMRKTMRVTHNLKEVLGHVPSVAYPLILSFVAVLLSGVSTETLRAPMIWIVLGVACRYFAIEADVRAAQASNARVERNKPAASTSSLEA